LRRHLLDGLSNALLSVGEGQNVRYWHLADIRRPAINVRYWGKNGHRVDVPQCLLLTQSGLLGARLEFTGLELVNPLVLWHQAQFI
jgi:hypothetical protein